MDYVRRRNAIGMVSDSLERLGLTYSRTWSFDEVGLRRFHFDFAVFCDGDASSEPSFLVVVADGADTSDAALAALGMRPCRRPVAVERSRLRLASLSALAASHGIPCLVLDDAGVLNSYATLRAWAFVSREGLSSSETDAVRFLDSVCDDFVYVLPSPGARLDAVRNSGVLPKLSCGVMECVGAPCWSDGVCPHGVL